VVHLGARAAAPEVIAGITLLAIAIPEQLATAQLADVPSFLAILAFIAGSLVFAVLGSNPIISVGADSTIAPLFAIALVRLAMPASPDYLVLVAATAVLTGCILALVGVAKLGWIADFLSLPLVVGFMCGVGFTIIVHQLPNFLGLHDVSGTVVHRVGTIATHLSATNGWTVTIAAGTLVVLAVGERLTGRVPWALLAVVATTLVVKFGDLARHGVATLGTVSVVGPSFRLGAFHWSDAGVVVTTALTVAVVVLSQTAATSRNAADELGVDVDINRDFLAVGTANIVTGLLGTIPVNASPARTGVVAVAGGRTPLVSLVAGLGALCVIPLAPALRELPLAALAGVLLYVAGRLIKVGSLRQILRVDRYELALAIITGLAVILIGVQEGIAVAVVLAVFDQTRRSARPRSAILGRRPGSTSWEPVGVDGATLVDGVTVLLFTAPLYFVNAGLFRAEVHAALRQYPATKHLVIDAAAITDLDYTGLVSLTAVVTDLAREGVRVVMARTDESVTHTLTHAPSPAVRALVSYGTVDEAVAAVSVAPPSG
jgi:sulfate permease, SulP family